MGPGYLPKAFEMPVFVLYVTNCQETLDRRVSRCSGLSSQEQSHWLMRVHTCMCVCGTKVCLYIHIHTPTPNCGYNHRKAFWADKNAKNRVLDHVTEISSEREMRMRCSWSDLSWNSNGTKNNQPNSRPNNQPNNPKSKSTSDLVASSQQGRHLHCEQWSLLTSSLLCNITDLVHPKLVHISQCLILVRLLIDIRGACCRKFHFSVIIPSL